MTEATERGRSDGGTAPRPWVIDLLARLLTVFAVAVATCVALAATALLTSRDARAADAAAMRPGPLSGGLVLGTDAGERAAAPLLGTDVRIRVNGMVARAEVTQTFRNPQDDWLEGVYVFPLPENAAVDHLSMRIGGREVEGQIRERAQAKQDYERAKAAGVRSALLEQERPNVFTASVANIGPKQKIVVRIEYQQTLRYEAGRWSLRLPMGVGPRYIPGNVPVTGEPGTGWAPDSGARGQAQNTTRVSDAARITPPVLPPRADEPPVNPVSIRVELDAGVPLAEIDSPYHPFTVRTIDHRRQVVELAEGATPATRDFELVWKPVVDGAPRVAWFGERGGDRHYGLLMVMPPNAGPAARIAREAIYVVDTSGSMHGTSIEQAKQALEYAVDRLAPGDSFNVIEFNSYARSLWPDARPASRENRAEARGWIRALRAQGGTEMAKALELALAGREHPGRVRQVVFLTDGQVGNEDELFRIISGKLGDSRLFTVGIGSAPNSHFMTQAAKEGRGTFTYIGKIGEVREKMTELFAKLESPVLTGLRVDWPEGAAVESWPKQIPDLYAGEPVVVTAALDRLAGEVRVSGVRGNERWQTAVALAGAESAEGSGVGVLWARDKIAALMESPARGSRRGESDDEIRARVVELALTHHLVTKYTSLIAVDRAPARPAGLELKTAAVPTNLPEGQSYEAIFGGLPVGELPQGATDGRLHLLVGLLFMLAGALLPARRRAAGAAAEAGAGR
jgi:Ca-activated chloride channel homolog